MKKSVGSKAAKPSRRPTRPSTHPAARQHRTSSRSVPPIILSPRSFREITPEKSLEKIRLPKEKPLHVLIVEDLEDDARLMVRELERGEYSVQYLRVDTREAMARALEAHSWDVVLSDHSMPKFNTPIALNEIKTHGLDLPFILVSGSIGCATCRSLSSLPRGSAPTSPGPTNWEPTPIWLNRFRSTSSRK
jgi:CheY-like chemotaxis protein